MKSAIALAILFTLAASEPLAASPADPSLGDIGVTTLSDGGSELWLVELKGPPTSDGASLDAVEQEQGHFRQQAAARGVTYSERRVFQTLWNGFVLAIPPAQRELLEGLDDVAAIHPIHALEISPSSEILEPQLVSALSMTGADVAQNQLGLTGAGVRVGIIDTGVDYDHPDLGGDGLARTNSSVFPNARVVTGWDFLANDPYPDDDQSGHGTHVAGIIGANGVVRGVAPGVRFGAYRASSTDQVIAAMELALADGMQVVNISMGLNLQWPKSPLALAADRLVKQGVVVTSSMGNLGTSGLYGASAPAVGKKVIGVASVDNELRNVPAFTMSANTTPFVYRTARGSVMPLQSGTYPLGTGADVSGKVGLYRDIICNGCGPAGSLNPLYDNALFAQQHGAIAVIVHGDDVEFFQPVIRVPAGGAPIVIPVVAISNLEALRLRDGLFLGPVDLTWHNAYPIPVATGGLISGTSSWGPSQDLDLKPDVGAPGGFMHSTWPVEIGWYANLAGTSMASAHVAGAAALMLEADPHASPDGIRTALRNTARPRPASSHPSHLEPIQRQGAGLVDISAAIQATTRIEPSALALGESEAGPAVRQITIRNDSGVQETYDLIHAEAYATGPNRFPVSFLEHSTSVVFSPNPVTVGPAGSAIVTVTIASDPTLPDHSVYGGYLSAIPRQEGAPVRVPYVGFKGDYESVPVLTTTANYPWLARDRDPNSLPTILVPVPDGWTFMMADVVRRPWFRWHLDHPASQFRIEVFDAETNQSWHRIADTKWPTLSTAPSGTFSFPRWNGVTFHGQQTEVVPDGHYVIHMSALRGLGDASDPTAWDTWTSPRFFIVWPNVSIASVVLTRNVVALGEPVGIVTTVRNSGGDAAAGVAFTVKDGDSEIHTETLDLAADETRVIEVPWSASNPAGHQLRVSLSSLPSEDDLADNEATLEVIPGEAVVAVGWTGAPAVLALSPAQPNPFTSSTDLSFSLPRPGPATLEVFDLQGRRVRGWNWSKLESGRHQLRWDGRTEDGRRVSAGALIVRLSVDERVITRKAVRLP